HAMVRRYLLRFLEYVAAQTKQQWDQAFFEASLPQRLAWGVPILVWYAGVAIVPHLAPQVELVVRRVLLASLVIVLVRGIDALLDAINRIYVLNPRARERPIKGFLQVGNVLTH